MRFVLLCTAVCALPLDAQVVDVTRSMVSIEEPTMDGAWVDVLFQNHIFNSAADDMTYVLGQGIMFTFDFTTGDDTVEVIPPEGFFCLPSCVMTVPEHESARVSLFTALDMVGM